MFRKRSYIGRVTDTATAAHPEGFDMSVTCTMAKSEIRHTGLARALRAALTAGALGGLVTQADAALITVNTVADNLSSDTFCSLREAIDNVNHASTVHSDCAPVGSYGPDTIVFDSTVFPPNGLTAIVVTSELVLEPSTVTTIDGGGVVAIDGGGTTRVFRTTQHSNNAFHALTIRNGYYLQDGTGIYNAYGATTVLDQSTISGNRSPLAGGGIRNDGSMTLTNCAITNNIAYSHGGGIFNYGGTLVLTNSTVSGNRAIGIESAGGGIDNMNIGDNIVGTLTLSNSTLSGNTGSYGGGIQNEGHATLINSTLAGNVANHGGGIGSFGFGGTSPIPKTWVTNSTLASNTSVTGGAIYMSGMAYSYLTNTIVSNSSGSTNCYAEVRGNIFDGGGNIDDGASCAFGGGSFPNTNPQLGSLGNNGGPTATKLPIAGSPAIDAIACSSSPATDQRGIPRPQGAQCDIGAIEREAIEISIFLDSFEGY